MKKVHLLLASIAVIAIIATIRAEMTINVVLIPIRRCVFQPDRNV